MNVVVAGGGAAGMIAACISAKCGNKVTLIEKNEKLGKKLFITGKGRCNLTNACDDDEFFKNVVTNPKFLYSAYYGFTNRDVCEFFESRHLKLKTERGNRVFPASDHSSDVIGTLKAELNRLGVEVLLNTKVANVLVSADESKADVTGVSDDGDLHNIAYGVTVIFPDKSRKEITADKIILATGGKSYAGCGADGDTWRFADALNIKTKPAEPSLVPFEVEEDYVKDLQGLSLKNVSLTLFNNEKVLYTGFGEMLFTHFGLSGPLILTASTFVTEKMYSGNIAAGIDLKPALSFEELDKRILRDFEKEFNKQFSNSLSGLLPAKLIPVIVKLSGIDAKKKVNAVTKEERMRLVRLLKDLRFHVTGNRGFDEAIITRGGIDVKEINPKTMESKKIKGLFFAGEMIDVDCMTGGFNLQAAWCTGHAAGCDM